MHVQLFVFLDYMFCNNLYKPESHIVMLPLCLFKLL